MKKLRISLYILAVLGSFGVAFAGPLDEARRLYNNGDYHSAVEHLRKIIKKTPKDGNAHYYLGLSYQALGNEKAARESLLEAESRGVGEAARILAEQAMVNYEFDDAREHIDAWENSYSKSKKNVPQQLRDMSAKLVQLSNMMERVEKIEIIDSMQVDAAQFFNYYHLSPASGKLLPPDAIERSIQNSDFKDISVAYMPQNRSQLLWGATDQSGVSKLYRADILDDGTFDVGVTLSDNLNEGGNAAYPFLMPDGMTLYFANDGENSIGGYDIFMTRRSDDGSWFQPQNMGFPYNSTANDYMLAIDETSKLGWWATDRNCPDGKVNIYIFAPSNSRVNVDPSDDNLIALARLTDISLTQNEGRDYKALLKQRMPAEEEGSAVAATGARFVLDLGNGKIYTSLKDFRKADARSAMLETLAAEVELNRHLEAEDKLREQYRKGRTDVRGKILDSEAQTEQLRQRIITLRNKAITTELRR